MLEVIILQGLQGSGKTTWAKEQVKSNPLRYVRISNDDMRAMFSNSIFTKENEALMLSARDVLILNTLRRSRTPIVDATHLNPKHIHDITALVKAEFPKATITIKDFIDVPLEECIRRDAQRENPVGEAVIRKTYNRWKHTSQTVKDDVFRLDYIDHLPGCYVFDLDGTMALVGNRSPYDASRCDETDRPNWGIVSLARKLMDENETVFFVSGREERFREPTDRWLTENGVNNYAGLFMRRTKDGRKDSIVKREIWETHFKDQYNIYVWFDDRQQVVDAMRALGITVAQVAEGNF